MKALRFTQIRQQRKRDCDMLSRLCFIDIETTGSIFGFHEITELGAVITTPDASEIIDTFQTRIKPKYPERITDVAKNLSDFSEETWVDAKISNKEMWQNASQFWTDCTPVCHNPTFERAFITLAMVDAGITSFGLDYHWIGTESLAWPFYLSGRIKKLSLLTLLNYFDLPPEPLPHRAANGALSCRSVYIKLIDALQKAT